MLSIKKIDVYYNRTSDVDQEPSTSISYDLLVESRIWLIEKWALIKARVHS